MQENNIRLIDEAIVSEPIKNTFRLGWEFITLNKQFTFSIMAVIMVLTLLGMVPVVGFVFTLFSSVFSLAVQIYAGRLIYETENIETFVSSIKNADGQTLVERHFSPALGAYMGWMVMALLFIGLVSLAIDGMDMKAATTNAELVAMLSTLGLPLLVLVFLFSYVQPLVQSNVVMSNNFKEGFFAVMSIFSPNVWQRAMQGRYFKYMFFIGLIVLSLGFSFGLLFSLFSAIPLLNLLFMMVFVYILMIIMVIASMMAKRIVE